MQEEKLNNYEQIANRVNQGLIAYILIDNEINMPVLKKGDKVAIRKNSTYKVGDLVLYLNVEEYNLRRIVSIDESKLIVSGDNEKNVRIISDYSVFGKVISLERGMKRISASNSLNQKYIRKARIKHKSLKHLEVITEIDEEFNDAYKKAINATKKKKSDPQKHSRSVMPIDEQLAKDLAVFKSPQEKFDEFYYGPINEEN